MIKQLAFSFPVFVFSLPMQDTRFIPFSECAVLLSFGNTIDEGIHEQVMKAKQMIESAPLKGFIETVGALLSHQRANGIAYICPGFSK